MTLLILAGALLAYLLGSVPTAVWYGLAFSGIDIRTKGSGNAGATNTFRVLGKRAGIIVLLIDVLKGWLAANLALMMNYAGLITTEERLPLKMLFGVIAVLGHLFPVFARFRGGKGVATLLGVMMSIHPEAAGTCIGVFLLILLLTGYVSLSSMVAALAFPLMLGFNLFGKEKLLLIVFGAALALLIVYTHHKNIYRLLRGQENRVGLGGKGKKI